MGLSEELFAMTCILSDSPSDDPPLLHDQMKRLSDSKLKKIPNLRRKSVRDMVVRSRRIKVWDNLNQSYFVCHSSME
ncbi:MAG: hypothetical protein VX004_09855, partial [SAR324 cluster bacterium]|nr:hypothetical protein [SAR324 cluster bacterium]